MSDFFRHLVSRLRRGLGNKATARRPLSPRRFAPSLEALSDRIVPTLTPFFDPLSGALTITGDNTGETGVMAVDASGNITLSSSFIFPGVGTGATLSTITSLTINTSGGNDSINLSALPDLGVPVTIDGGSGNDTLIGSDGDDTIRGGFNNDNLYGGYGDDDLDGGLHNDNLYGDEDDDTLRDSNATDSFDGGSGSDKLIALSAVANTFNVTGSYQGDLNGQSFVNMQVLVGGNLADTFDVGGGTINELRGLDGNDTFDLMGGVVNNDVEGGNGVDHLTYANATYQVSVNLTTGGATSVGGLVSQVENVTGGNNKDLLVGDSGANRMDGGNDDDVLLAQGGNDTLIESLGGDYYQGSTGADELIAMDTDNEFFIDGVNSGRLNGESFSGIENLTGGSGKDDFVLDDAGEVTGTMKGRGGVNALSYLYRSSGGVTVNLATGTATDAGAISGIAIVIGSPDDDTLTGDNGDNVLVGGHSEDVIDGGAGRDIVIGGDDADEVSGGSGEDIVIGGWTSWDMNPDGLREIRAIWRDPAVLFFDRIDDLRTAGWLDAGHVFADDEDDTLEGGTNDDWFWSEVDDLLPDFNFVEEQDTETEI